jgi:hypothetical protein
MNQREPVTFDTEAALCQAFLLWVSDEWIAYPETAGFDIVLVHRVGGWQIGVEAKKSLNAKVITQAMGGRRGCGPDFRAVLVGKASPEMCEIARRLGLTVIAPRGRQRARMMVQRDGFFGWEPMQGPIAPEFTPDLPEAEAVTKIETWWGSWWRETWFDHFPERRCPLPEYVPEVAAGVPAPMVLSDWKIKAMRVCVWVERTGEITRAHFRALGLDPSRWMNGIWLKQGAKRGAWLAGPHFPAAQFRREHPGIFAKIEGDFEKWSGEMQQRLGGRA